MALSGREALIVGAAPAGLGLRLRSKIGAGEGIRTLGIFLGKEVLYP